MSKTNKQDLQQDLTNRNNCAYYCEKDGKYVAVFDFNKSYLN